MLPTYLFKHELERNPGLIGESESQACRDVVMMMLARYTCLEARMGFRVLVIGETPSAMFLPCTNRSGLDGWRSFPPSSLFLLEGHEGCIHWG